MFLDDVAHDGEAEAGAAAFGGEVGQEKFLTVLGGDAGSGIGDGEFDGFGSGRGGGDEEAAQGAILHGFGGVVDEIDDDALDLVGIEAQGRKLGSEIKADVDVVEASGEDGESVVDDVVEIGRTRLGGGEARELGELIDESAEGFDFLRDELGAFANDTGLVGRGSGSAIEHAAEAFGGEGDGGEGVLDLVRDAAGDFVPGGGFLGAEEFAGVFEDEDEAGVLFVVERGEGDAQVEGAAVEFEVEGAGGEACTAGALHEVEDLGGFFGGEEILEVVGMGAIGEDGGEGTIGAEDAAIGSEGEHAGGDAFENGFGEAAAAFEFAIVDLEGLGHFVEGADEEREFVDSLDADAVGEIAGADFLGTLEESGDGERELFGEEESDPGGEEENEETDENDELDVELAELAFLRTELFVAGFAFADLAFALGEIHGDAADEEEGAAIVDGGGDLDALRSGAFSGADGDLVIAILDPGAFEGEALTEVARDGLAAAEAGGEPKGLGFELRAGFAIDLVADIDQVLDDEVGGAAEPLIEVAVHDLDGKDDEEENGQEDESEGSDNELGTDPGAFEVGLTLDVDLDRGAEEHEAERDGEEKDESGDGPEEKDLGGGFGSVVTEVEGALPHNERGENREQEGGSADPEALAHG